MENAVLQTNLRSLQNSPPMVCKVTVEVEMFNLNLQNLDPGVRQGSRLLVVWAGNLPGGVLSP